MLLICKLAGCGFLGAEELFNILMIISPQWSLSALQKCKFCLYFSPDSQSENQILLQQGALTLGNLAPCHCLWGAVGETGINVLEMSEFREVNTDLCRKNQRYVG